MRSIERFSDRAADYAFGRSAYPAAAIDALFAGLGDPAGLTVVDLGAGTGIAARLLAARGSHVIAIEPNVAMRDAAIPVANVRWQSATAEATGIAGKSVDLVVAFQAFHWFDHAPTLREMRRILRGAGRAAIVLNERDDSDPFTAAYSVIARRHATDMTDISSRRNTDGQAEFAGFGGWQRVWMARFVHSQALDRSELHARAASTSYLPNTGPAASLLHDELDALFDRYGITGQATMCMTTTVTNAE